MKAIVLSASSDIGIELIKSLNEKGYEVFIIKILFLMKYINQITYLN